LSNYKKSSYIKIKYYIWKNKNMDNEI